MTEEIIKYIVLGFLGLWIVAVIVFAIVYHIKNYLNNKKHPEHEARIVLLKNGKFQVQEWIGNCWADPDEDYICIWQEAKSFLKTATFDTLEEARKAKEEHNKIWENKKNGKPDKTDEDKKNGNIVDKVIEGAID